MKTLLVIPYRPSLIHHKVCIWLCGLLLGVWLGGLLLGVWLSGSARLDIGIWLGSLLLGAWVLGCSAPLDIFFISRLLLSYDYTQYGVQGMVDFFRLVVSLIFHKFLIVLVPYFIPYFLKIFKSSLMSWQRNTIKLHLAT